MDLQVQDIRFRYKKNGNYIIDGISFDAGEGDVTAIIGANGVGKSTLVRSLLGLLHSEGTVLMGGKNRNEYTRNQITRHIGYLTQENAFLSSLTVFEVVMLGQMNSLGFRVQNTEVERVWDVLTTLRISHLAKNRFFELSGGQRRIVGIAQTIVRDPDILILDEPTANLDMQNQLEVLELIRSYTKEKKLTTLVILHDLNMACRYSDRLILLKDGRVYASGPPAQVITKETVKDVYGVLVNLHHDRQGIPMIHPVCSVRTLDAEKIQEEGNEFTG